MRREKGSWKTLLLESGLVYLGLQLYKVIRTHDIAGEVVLVTGGSRGLGLVLARQFAREGCRVALCARDEQELGRAQQEIARTGAEVMVYRCDVSDRDRVEEMIAAVEERFGRIDIVVNNAAIIQVGPFDAMTAGDFERAMAVNFWGPLHVIWAALPRMRERGRGQLVNITSLAGEVPVPHLLPYDCAKAAFLALSEGLHAELARHGIAVTTIVPGFVRTGQPINASFKGNAESEFKWFSVGDSMVLTSTSAEHAARRIVSSAKRGEGKVVVSWQAKLVRLAHGLVPNAVLRALSLMGRLLPSERGLRFESRRGQELTAGTEGSRLQRRLDETARRLNQYVSPDPQPGRA